jgi:AcrR family transcriptional regulator
MPGKKSHSPRQLLAAAAIAIAMQGGIADLSLRELAAAIGTSHRMLLYHFGSREGLPRLPKVLKIERPDVMAGRVQVLAAGQAPGAAHRLVAVAADPEPGRVVPAADAEVDGVR